ncbi:MAG: type II toxin-antitoxin system RelE/ParE family toxin [Betaproteobacteria bacterium]|nr:type II toxin-antitoxin system RelE/ParE family toxin [Betaproteobacteria bacterium]
MKLYRLERAQWDVTALVEECNDGITCPLTDFFGEAGKNYAGSINGMLDLFVRFSQSGPETFNDALCHYVDQNERIWEFVKGNIRVLWFYGTGSRIIVCSHGFIKKTAKVPPKEVKRAIAAKRRYETATNSNQIEIIEDEGNGD